MKNYRITVAKLLIFAILFPTLFPSVALAAKVNLQDSNQVQGITQVINGGTGNASGVIAASAVNGQVASAVAAASAVYAITAGSATTAASATYASTAGTANAVAGASVTGQVASAVAAATATALSGVSALPNGTTATTQSPGDSSSKIATDAFVAALTASAVQTAPAHIAQITATVASSAVTISATSQYLDFRSATLGSGAVSTVLAAPSNLVIPSGATLGCLNAAIAATCQVMVLETLPTSGVPELAVVNISGGNNLDETTLLTTTTISSGATSASGVYATAGRSSLPFRVIGTFVAAETTAGTWATAPSLVQGAGGQAIASMQSLGYGQTWQNVTGSRVSGTTYYNTTGKPIALSIYMSGTTSYAVIYVNGVVISQNGMSASTVGGQTTYCIVPPGMAYSAALVSISAWMELR